MSAQAAFFAGAALEAFYLRSPAAAALLAFVAILAILWDHR